MRYITRPLTPEARARIASGARGQQSQFASTWPSTLDLLDRELWHLGVRDEFVLQIDCSEADLRIDGQLRANARHTSPAVAIAIESRSKGSLLFTCGRFNQWQDNVRAIALGLEALRKVERYGIVQSDEQYRGWQALPPGTPMPAAKMTVEAARELLRVEAGWITGPAIDDDADIGKAYRWAAHNAHPDHGGTAERFAAITEARDLLLGARR